MIGNNYDEGTNETLKLLMCNLTSQKFPYKFHANFKVLIFQALIIFCMFKNQFYNSADQDEILQISLQNEV